MVIALYGYQLYGYRIIWLYVVWWQFGYMLLHDNNLVQLRPIRKARFWRLGSSTLADSCAPRGEILPDKGKPPTNGIVLYGIV